MTDENLPRELELLVDEALQGLCPDDWVELNAIMPPSAEREALLVELELLAAAVAASDTVLEKLPAGLAARLQSDLDNGRSELQVKAQRAREIAPVVPLAIPARQSAKPRATATRLAAYAGWAAAAAVALGFWLSWPGKPPVVLSQSASEQRAALLASAGAHRVEWTQTTDPGATGASGDVVWSPSRQSGFMRFHGLSKNDPKKFQYQLWIFDAEHDERHPVDGGVFDIGANGEVLVAIRPRVPVHKAALFAITIEPPGGVVVSKREHIVVTAALPPT